MYIKSSNGKKEKIKDQNATVDIDQKLTEQITHII